MKKSTQVTLTVAAAMGLAARGQQPLNPCNAASFNGGACREAVQHSRLCWQGTWNPISAPEPYPYYYGAYRDYVANGGVVTPVETGNCGHLSAYRGAGVHGGFGGTGAGHHSHHAGG
jgi:hypothetical protein